MRTGIPILIVDDNQDAADLQAAVLQSMGHETMVAYNGLTAIKAAETFAARLFLLDLALPDMDGYELVRRLRGTAHRDARFVAVTGYPAGTGGRLAGKLFDEHVVKPMTPEIIEEVIKRVPRTAD